MYNPAMGVWTIRDSAQEGLNLYENVKSNPANLTDPLGLSENTGIVVFKGVNIIRVKTRKDMPRTTVMGETSPQIASMEYTVEIKNGKCGVVVARAEWEITSLRYADEYVFNDQAPRESLNWNWTDYEKAKAMNLSDMEWHELDIGSWHATEAHEDAHAQQIKDVAGAALAQYIKKYNANPEFTYDEPHSAMVQANKMSNSKFYWSDALGPNQA